MGKAYATLEGILDNENASPEHRIAAAKEVLNRAYGQAPSMQVIQGLVEHEHKVSIPPEMLERMDQAKLAQLEAALAGVIEDAQVIDPDESGE